ncbi:MAG TPA: nuclear transport factor 2 family protein [Thermoleophilaceae bacterium]|nr:nuclear transport factor 2 family protein [Thermoleophilaceae bacterium]
MQADAETREEILWTLGELRAAVSERRIEGVLSLFAPDADTTLIGSSAGEIARGPIELRALLERIFAAPQTVGWEWDDVSVSSCGDVAWLWLEGALALDGRSDRAYRITGVLERRSGRWLWTLFHGSEPS